MVVGGMGGYEWRESGGVAWWGGCVFVFVVGVLWGNEEGVGIGSGGRLGVRMEAVELAIGGGAFFVDEWKRLGRQVRAFGWTNGGG